MEKILITGGSGFLGKYLTRYLTTEGQKVSILSRKILPGISSFLWNPGKNNLDVNALKDAGTIIHLAGAGIVDKRWTASYKKQILESRIQSAALLFESIKKMPGQVHTFISASAVGFYGDSGNVWVDEDFHSRDDFLGIVCREWEKSARMFETLGIRVVILRIGIVLAKDGGALPHLALPVKFFAGAPLGNGRQYLSWIHIMDLVRIFHFAVKNKKMHGIYNAVAPGPVTNKTITRIIASVLNRFVWPFHIPAFILKMILGEKASIILEGQRVSSEKIRRTGFVFNHTDIHKSLKELLKTTQS